MLPKTETKKRTGAFIGMLDGMIGEGSYKDIRTNKGSPLAPKRERDKGYSKKEKHVKY